jgi:aminoglycoside phosphotransferase (APT) family kinase protein
MTVRQAHRANPGLGSANDVLDRYARSSGLDFDGIDFYLALATLKMAVIVAGARRRSDSDRLMLGERQAFRDHA